MTKDETIRVLEWLQNMYPKQYSPNMTAQRRTDLLDAFYEAFRRFSIHDTMDACKQILQTEDSAPTVSSILARCRGKAQSQSSRRQRPPLDLTGLPDDHPYRGCYYHKEAYEAYMLDFRAHALNGRDFSDYCKMYPATVWRPWADIENNRDRIEDPAGQWYYMKDREYRGWTVNDRGFCVPK